MQAYIFYREQGFYTLDLKDDNDAIANAVYNEGTLKVTDLAGRVIWQKTIQICSGN